MHLVMISQQELRGYPVSLVVSYAVYKPHRFYLGETHLDLLQTLTAEGATATSQMPLPAKVLQQTPLQNRSESL